MRLIFLNLRQRKHITVGNDGKTRLGGYPIEEFPPGAAFELFTKKARVHNYRVDAFMLHYGKALLEFRAIAAHRRPSGI